MKTEEMIKFIENRCNGIELPNRRLSKNVLLLVGYIYGYADAIDMSHKNHPA